MADSIIIIGGGASGLCAAVCAAQSGNARILLLERGARVGKKLLATGNGRCNLTNRYFSEQNYHGHSPEFTRPAFIRYGLKQTLRFFQGLGLVMQEEDGKLYPRSFQASSVLDALRFECDKLGVQTRCEAEVTAIQSRNGKFLITVNGSETIWADKVLIAAGGPASPKLGGTDSGCRLLQSLGHHVTPCLPSIVQLKTDTSTIRPLSGIKVQGTASLFSGKQKFRTESGEILFTDYGLSGPPILQLSCIATRLLFEKAPDLAIQLDLFPDFTPEELLKLCSALCASHPERPLEQYLLGVTHKRVAQAALKAAEIGPLSLPCSSLGARERSRLVSQLKRWRIPLTGTTGLTNAQVTAGGAMTAEFDPQTMESRLVPGFYACGEVLDIDGDCGGFNLQWAWSSAMLAAASMLLP